jgi:hypothetical protein
MIMSETGTCNDFLIQHLMGDVTIQRLDLNKRATVEEKCADRAFLVRMCVMPKWKK